MNDAIKLTLKKFLGQELGTSVPFVSSSGKILKGLLELNEGARVSTFSNMYQNLVDTHRKCVEIALSEGYYVSPEVMKDYPDFTLNDEKYFSFASGTLSESEAYKTRFSITEDVSNELSKDFVSDCLTSVFQKDLTEDIISLAAKSIMASNKDSFPKTLTIFNKTVNEATHRSSLPSKADLSNVVDAVVLADSFWKDRYDQSIFNGNSIRSLVESAEIDFSKGDLTVTLGLNRSAVTQKEYTAFLREQKITEEQLKESLGFVVSDLLEILAENVDLSNAEVHTPESVWAKVMESKKIRAVVLNEILTFTESLLPEVIEESITEDSDDMSKMCDLGFHDRCDVDSCECYCHTKNEDMNEQDDDEEEMLDMDLSGCKPCMGTGEHLAFPCAGICPECKGTGEVSENSEEEAEVPEMEDTPAEEEGDSDLPLNHDHTHTIDDVEDLEDRLSNLESKVEDVEEDVEEVEAEVESEEEEAEEEMDDVDAETEMLDYEEDLEEATVKAKTEYPKYMVPSLEKVIKEYEKEKKQQLADEDESEAKGTEEYFDYAISFTDKLVKMIKANKPVDEISKFIKGVESTNVREAIPSKIFYYFRDSVDESIVKEDLEESVLKENHEVEFNSWMTNVRDRLALYVKDDPYKVASEQWWEAYYNAGEDSINAVRDALEIPRDLGLEESVLKESVDYKLLDDIDREKRNKKPKGKKISKVIPLKKKPGLKDSDRKTSVGTHVPYGFSQFIADGGDLSAAPSDGVEGGNGTGVGESVIKESAELAELEVTKVEIVEASVEDNTDNKVEETNVTDKNFKVCAFCEGEGYKVHNLDEGLSYPCPVCDGQKTILIAESEWDEARFYGAEVEPVKENYRMSFDEFVYLVHGDVKETLAEAEETKEYVHYFNEDSFRDNLISKINEGTSFSVILEGEDIVFENIYDETDIDSLFKENIEWLYPAVFEVAVSSLDKDEYLVTEDEYYFTGGDDADLKEHFSEAKKYIVIDDREVERSTTHPFCVALEATKENFEFVDSLINEYGTSYYDVLDENGAENIFEDKELHIIQNGSLACKIADTVIARQPVSETAKKAYPFGLLQFG